MRIPIRWKLLLFIGVPVLLAYLAVGVTEFIVLRRDAMQIMQKEVQLLAQLQAEAFNMQLSEAQKITNAYAAFFQKQPDLELDEIHDLLRTILDSDDLIAGVAVAYEPFQSYDPSLRITAPYMWLQDGEYKLKDIGLEAYDYLDREWYTVARDPGRPGWTEPYYGPVFEGLLCTYSVPFFRDGRIRGVVTIDLDLVPLQETIPDAGIDDEAFAVFSRSGAIISHPDESLILTKTVDDLIKDYDDPQFKKLRQNIADATPGSARVTGFPMPYPHWMVLTPIQATGWTMSVSVPESSVMAPVYMRIRSLMMILGGGLVVILVAIFVVGSILSRPVTNLASAVSRMRAGDLSAQAENISNRDELGDLARGFNDMTTQLQKQIDQLALETAAREAVESEIRVGRKIQVSLLPQDFPAFPQHPEIGLYAINSAAKEVAGDFFDFFMVNGKLIVLIADVSGKGVPAALFMAVSRTILRNLANTGATPDEILTAANTLLVADNNAGLFVTLILLQYDPKSGHFSMANGGHPPPFKITTDGAVEPYGESTGTVIGMIPDQKWGKIEGHLKPGESLVLYTDGVSEAGGKGKQMLGIDGTQALIEPHSSEDPEQLCNSIVSYVHEYEDGNQGDDITVLVLKHDTPSG